MANYSPALEWGNKLLKSSIKCLPLEMNELQLSQIAFKSRKEVELQAKKSLNTTSL